MVRIGISVEGSTEVRFIQMLLQPYLEKQNIFVTPVSMRGNIIVTPYRKVTHGPDIALKIGLHGIRKKCSGFNEWLKKLETL